MPPDRYELLELKARCADLQRAREWAEDHAEFVDDVVQVDTYFSVPRGRLKLREVEDRPEATLVYYLREDMKGPKGSTIRLAEVEKGPPLRTLLEEALGVRVVVRKRRRVYRHGHVQIHLDWVEGLGTFLEFERPVASKGDRPSAEEEFRRLRKALGVEEADLVAGSYSDLMEDRPQGV